ncbi:S-adenosylmethionine-dependent methyltransferase, YraL family [Anaerococcus hydrogenalis DSM 7454]|uniref:Ribosomal RNA small subunit methyltransferase I n=1 Tax=Anaerococcus hydrogenalis DSM 7454 TaxID=561177 RepID=B6W8C9_9FIRM|nr:16S rRNA (cytidine(1402)-2'-O)-methyltransferase [Anaerococcus hydrogenalis]EEB36528.1 S-adenosylmethionine-dependent methyltransferase, YraL family [Anaerococcus hydrogenalis DSM 7454]
MDYSIYFVPTPIGNLEDMTIRAINVLKNVDIIACEDTRESKKLLNHFDINKKLTSYHKFNEKQKSKEIIENTKEGITYAIITDQGMPGISDPGHILIKECIENNISYTILPGPSSILTGLIASGFDNNSFSYYGFIPKKSSDKKKLYQELKNENKTSILFDTPHNLENTINDFKKEFPERKLAITRELSKKFEQYQIFKIKHIKCEDITFKGEFVLVLEKNLEKENLDITSFKDEILQLKKEGKSTKDIVKSLKKSTSFSKNDIYNYVITLV